VIILTYSLLVRDRFAEPALAQSASPTFPPQVRLMAFTYFFRDAEPLEIAIEQMLPVVQAMDSIDIWDAGCAHGPEPYTLAILCRERMPERLFQRLRIHATDVDSGFAAQVGAGVFRESELRRLPGGIRDEYFRPLGDASEYEVVEGIRSKIAFSHHDLLSLVPLRSNLSLIVCKNVLLHFNEEQRCRVLRMFHSALRFDGVLVMEHTQKIPAALGGMFQPMVGHAQVYAKVAIPSQRLFREDSPADDRRRNLWKKTFSGNVCKPEN
jgi:chemotaxis protein methyltransferase CheR